MEFPQNSTLFLQAVPTYDALASGSLGWVLEQDGVEPEAYRGKTLVVKTPE